MVICLGLSGGQAAAIEPTPKQLWKQSPPPPFRVVAAEPVSDLSEKRAYTEAEWRRFLVYGSLNYADFATTDPATVMFPLRMSAPLKPSKDRLLDLEIAGSLAASRYAALGLRPPELHVEEGRFRALFVRDAGGAAAFYGRGLEKVEDPEDIFKRWTARPKGLGPIPKYLFIGENVAYAEDLSIFPAKGALSMAHELFHAIQASYPSFSRHERKGAHDGKWITEGIPDAIAPWALDGIRFNGASAFEWKKSLKSGSERFGKVLGLRPYDYPLDLRAVPYPKMKIQSELRGDGGITEMSSYMTSSFWRYVLFEKPKPSLEWKALPALMEDPIGRGKTMREDALKWADEAVTLSIPTFTDGLFRGFSAFIAERVEYPDQVMGSRQGVFAHPTWLEYMFQDGCPLITLNGSEPKPPTIDLVIPQLAAKCLRLKWTGPRHANSGAPTATLTATVLNSKNEARSVESLHIGHHGTSEGFFASYKDQGTGATVKLGNTLDLDPLNPSKTNNELVVTLTNVARSPLDTAIQQYRITIIVNSSQAQGTVTQPADSEAKRPASTGKSSGKRRNHPGVSKPTAQDGVGIGAADASGDIDELYDCFNGMFKQLSAGALLLNSKVREKQIATEPPPQCNMLTKIADPAFKDRFKGKMGVEIRLPPIATGHKGGVKGAVVSVGWSDPAMRPQHNDDIGAETELVNVNITEATETYIRGGFSARFTEALHGVVGTVTGDFLQARADTSEFDFSEQPLDYFSSDMLLSFYYAGMDGKTLQGMAAEVAATARRERGAGGSTGGSGGASGGALPECSCSSVEFFSPKREDCAAQCLNYAPMALNYVYQRELAKGRTAASVEAEINACPASCAALDASGGRYSSLCADAIYPLRRSCAASGPGGVSQAQIDCYLNYLVRELEEPMKSQFRKTNADQISAMNQETKNSFLGGLLDALKAEGLSCQ